MVPVRAPLATPKLPFRQVVCSVCLCSPPFETSPAPRACAASQSSRERAPRLSDEVREANILAAADIRRAADLHAGLVAALVVPSPMAPVPVVAASPPSQPSCNDLLGPLYCGGFSNDRDNPPLQTLVAIILLRGGPPPTRPQQWFFCPRRRFLPPAFFGYFLAISWRHPHSVCCHEVANGSYWEDKTIAPKKHLAIPKRSHVAHFFALQM